LIDMAKMLLPQTAADASTHRLQQLAANLTNKQLSNANIPSKYWPLLRNISKVSLYKAYLDI